MAVWPFCFPCPRTSVTVRPVTPALLMASRTASTLSGRTIAFTSFIRPPTIRGESAHITDTGCKDGWPTPAHSGEVPAGDATTFHPGKNSHPNPRLDRRPRRPDAAQHHHLSRGHRLRCESCRRCGFLPTHRGVHAAGVNVRFLPVHRE